MSAPAVYLERGTTRDKRVSPPRAYGRYVVARRLRDAVVRLVGEVSGGNRPRLVDFGCGDMPYRGLIGRVVGSYEGIDLPGNKSATYHRCGDGSSTAPAGCADVVLSTQVLEHVRDVSAYLRECRRLLAADGRLILTTHGTWVYHADPHDYWRWTAEGLRAVMEEAGLEVVKVEGLIGLVPLGIQLAQDGIVRKLPKWMRPGACFCFQQAMLLADRVHTDADRAKDACIYAVVAKAKKE